MIEWLSEYRTPVIIVLGMLIGRTYHRWGVKTKKTVFFLIIVLGLIIGNCSLRMGLIVFNPPEESSLIKISEEVEEIGPRYKNSKDLVVKIKNQPYYLSLANIPNLDELIRTIENTNELTFYVVPDKDFISRKEIGIKYFTIWKIEGENRNIILKTNELVSYRRKSGLFILLFATSFFIISAYAVKKYRKP